MIFSKFITQLTVAIFICSCPRVSAASPTTILQQAIYTEETEGDIEAAAQLYQAILDGENKNLPIIAQATYRLAICHLKLGDKEGGIQLLNKFIQRFHKEETLLKQANAKLDALGQPRHAPELKTVWPNALDAAGRVSLDGKYYAFTDWNETGNIMVRNLITNKDKALTSKSAWDAKQPDYGTNPIFSPNTNEIAYRWFRSNNELDSSSEELRLVSIDGSRDQILFSNKGSILPLDWSSDKNQILFQWEPEKGTRQYVLSTINIHTRKKQLVKDLGANPVSLALFSPDGKFIAYDRHVPPNKLQRDIILYDIQDQSEEILIKHASDDRLLAWSNNGKRLLFTSDRRGQYDLFALDIEDKLAEAARLIYPGLGPGSSCGLTKDGELYFGVYTGGVNLYSAVLANTEAGILNPHEIANDVLRFAVSPDNKSVAIWQPQSGKYEYPKLGIMDLQTRNIRSIFAFESQTWVDIPIWLPDNKSILQRYRTGENEVSLVELNTVNGQIKEIFTGLRGPGDNAPGSRQSAVTSSQIAYIRWEDSRSAYVACRKSLNGDSMESRMILQEPQSGFEYLFKVNSDLTKVMYSVNSKEGSPDSKSSVCAYDFESERTIELYSSSNRCTVYPSPVSDFLVIVEHGNESLKLHAFDSSSAKFDKICSSIVTNLAQGKRYRSTGWSQDGGTFIIGGPAKTIDKPQSFYAAFSIPSGKMVQTQLNSSLARDIIESLPSGGILFKAYSQSYSELRKVAGLFTP